MIREGAITRGKRLLKRKVQNLFQLKLHFRNLSQSKRINRKYAVSKKIHVVFIIQFPEMWNSLKSVYDCMANDERFSANIVTVPKQHSFVNGVETWTQNSSQLFFEEEGISSIDAYKGQKWLSLSSLQPDYIFIQRPYDNMMPGCYSLACLSKIAKLCYIPYSGRLTKGVHMQVEFNKHLLENTSIIYADCDEAEEFISQNTLSILGKKIRTIHNLGYPRNDLVFSSNFANDKKSNAVLWMPRWTLNAAYDKSGFFDYYKPLVSYFKNNKDISLIIRPHPLMFTTFCAQGVLTEEEKNRIFMEIEAEDNISFDKNFDYLETFRNVDFLISDTSSLLLEFFWLRKPILYCGNIDIQDYTSTGKKIADTFYLIKDEDSLLKSLSQLINNCDSKAELRADAFNQVYKARGKAGELIAETIYIDAKGGF